MTIEYYKDAAGEYRWSLLAKNGKIVADGAEGYKTLANVKRAITSLLKSMKGTVTVKKALKAPSSHKFNPSDASTAFKVGLPPVECGQPVGWLKFPELTFRKLKMENPELNKGPLVGGNRRKC